MNFRYLYLFIFIFGFAKSYATPPADDVAKVRAAIMLGINSETVNDSLLKKLKAVSNPSALMQAYLATSYSLVAKHAWSPYTKIKYLIKSEDELAKAVKRDPNSLEIRFMRFSIESNCPSFIGFSKNLDADKKIILNSLITKSYGLVDATLAKRMVKYMIDSKRLTALELASLNNGTAKK